ncbi:hypothetical protein BH11PSE13_BH11PSE13_41970 [soil metagenome]
MKCFSGTALAAATIFAALALAGCASKPALYYTLANPANAQGAGSAGTAAPASNGTSVPAPGTGTAPLYIELAPLSLPERLARPQMVVKQNGDASAQVEVLEQHRWASSFEDELRDALSSGVASRLGAFDASKGGRQTSQPVYRIAVQVRRFDAIEGTRVDGSFSWTVRRSDETVPTACSFDTSEPVGMGIDAVAQGAQRVTANAASAIARSVTAAGVKSGGACG